MVGTPAGPRQLRADESLRLRSAGGRVNVRWQSRMSRGVTELGDALRTEIRSELGDLGGRPSARSPSSSTPEAR
jgi:hypothetical protein